MGIQCPLICDFCRVIPTKLASEDTTSELWELYDAEIHPIAMLSADMIVDDNNTENYEEKNVERTEESRVHVKVKKIGIILWHGL